MSNGAPQQFCVRWNSYQSNLQTAFPKLLTSEHFVDVTLACENEMLKCHKVVLSACSTYFEKLLLDNPCQHPIIFMKDMKFQEMQSLVDFMYKGEVNVTQDDLPSLLKSAEALQIRGLCGSDQLLGQQHLGQLKAQLKATAGASDGKAINQQRMIGHVRVEGAKERLEGCSQVNDGDSNEGQQQQQQQIQQQQQYKVLDEMDSKEEQLEEESYYEGEGELVESEYAEEDGMNNGNEDVKTPDYAIANVSCQYDGSPDESSLHQVGDMKTTLFTVATNISTQFDQTSADLLHGLPGASNRRIRRSDEELRRAAECITRGQTFQTVSDQFNIPISTIRFYMARKGILPRRKRGRACAGPAGLPLPTGAPTSAYNTPGNTSPIGPPYHIVHYKLPALGVSKLK